MNRRLHDVGLRNVPTTCLLNMSESVLCQESVVSCLNSVNGIDVAMVRRKTVASYIVRRSGGWASHLFQCTCGTPLLEVLLVKRPDVCHVEHVMLRSFYVCPCAALIVRCSSCIWR